MGYNAAVYCNCYKQGLAAEPPHKEYVVIDEDGSVNIKTDHIMDESTRMEWWLDFDKWVSTACSHEDMYYAHERLANMSGMSHFRAVVDEFGGTARFPIITKYLLIGNGGTLPLVFVQEAHNEISILKQEKTPQRLIVLQETVSGDPIASTSSNQPYTFVFSATLSNYSIDSTGFSIVKLKQHFWEKNKIIFQSNKFKQRRIDNNQFEFEDLATGNTCIQPIKLYPLNSEATKDYYLTVTIQQASIAAEYAYIIEPLLRILKASIETGNPVCWL